MAHLHTIRNKGLLNLPGITNASKSLTERLLLRDAETHHCFFNPAGFHNHLSHHVFAAYDMGAAPGLIQKIYDQHASYQRPLYPEEEDKDITITQNNWFDYLGNRKVYGAFFKFFCQEIEHKGVSSVLEQFLFSPEANNDGRNMLSRFVSGALHPFIQLGYGIEFGSDVIVATGIAQAAVHNAQLADLFPSTADENSFPNPPPTYQGPGRQPLTGPSLLEVIRQICDSEVLAPPLPYNPDLLLPERIRGATAGPKASEIRRISAQYTLSIPLDDAELDSRIEEIIWTVTLLMFATGRAGREARLDFFLMHLVTSSLFFPTIFSALKDARSKVMLIRYYVPVMITIMLSRGRPLIRPELALHWNPTPRPANLQDVLGFGKIGKGGSIGNLNDDEDYDPWPAIIQATLHHPDVHHIKAMRTLIYAAEKYGDTPAGEVIGAFRPATKDREGLKPEETFTGMSKLDGTLFVRAAGVMMNYMGWTVCGQPTRDWDRSALGWDGAWASKN